MNLLRRGFLKGLTAASVSVQYVGAYIGAMGRAVANRDLPLADQRVFGCFCGYGSGMPGYSGKPVNEHLVFDPRLERKLNEMYRTPDIIGMSDAQFEREWGPETSRWLPS